MYICPHFSFYHIYGLLLLPPTYHVHVPIYPHVCTFLLLQQCYPVTMFSKYTAYPSCKSFPFLTMYVHSSSDHNFILSRCFQSLRTTVYSHLVYTFCTLSHLVYTQFGPQCHFVFTYI